MISGRAFLLISSFVLSASWLGNPAGSQDKKPSPEAPPDLVKQLVRDSTETKACLDKHEGAVESIGLTLEEIDLDGDGTPEYILRVTSDPDDCGLCGVVKCPQWVYRKSEDGYRLLLGKNEADFSTLKTRTKGYLDIQNEKPSRNNTFDIEIYKWDGKSYVLTQCGEREIVGSRGEEPIYKTRYHPCK
jgi:hypothetical protein